MKCSTRYPLEKKFHLFDCVLCYLIKNEDNKLACQADSLETCLWETLQSGVHAAAPFEVLESVSTAELHCSLVIVRIGSVNDILRYIAFSKHWYNSY